MCVSPVKSKKNSEYWLKYSMCLIYFDAGISVKYVFLLDTCGICKKVLKFMWIWVSC